MATTAIKKQHWYVVGILVVLLLGGLAWILLAQVKPADGTAVCRETGMNHQVTIQNNKITPFTTKAMFCDTLTITSKDKAQRLVSFGVHDQHITYDGIRERLLAQGQSFTITLNKSGRYHFHDHHDETVEGYFEVDNTSRVE